VLDNCETKQCYRCNEVKPLSDFVVRSDKPHLRIGRCSACERLRQKNQSQKRPLKSEKAREYYQNNKEHIKTCSKTYWLANREKAKDFSKKWYREHRREVVEAVIKREKQRTKEDKLFATTRRVRALIRNSLKSKGFCKTSNTYKLLGCTYDEFMRYIGEVPKEGYELDHIVPCSCARNEEELLKLQHYSNLQWLSKEENRNKRAKKTVKGVILHYSLLNRQWE
jgi:hypothetical protein